MNASVVDIWPQLNRFHLALPGTNLPRFGRVAREGQAASAWTAGRGVAGDRRAANVAGFLGRERAAAMHGLAVVPRHQVANRPSVRVNEVALGGVFDEVAQKGARLGHRPAKDGTGVRRQEQ